MIIQLSSQRVINQTSLQLLMNNRHRIGLTSPPLVGIEKNPGPKAKGRKKLARDKPRNQRREAKKKTKAEDRGQFLMGFLSGMGIKKIARITGWCPKTVREWKKRHAETGELQRKPGSGRPKIFTDREESTLYVRAVRNRGMTAAQLADEMKNKEGMRKVSIWTIRRTLRRRGLYGRIARRKPHLSFLNQLKRLRWAHAHKNWTKDDWKQVVFSDESSILLWWNHRRYVRRFSKEDLHPACMIPTVKKGGGRVCFWGAFSIAGVSPLRRIKGIMNTEVYEDILENSFVPFLHQCGPPQVAPDAQDLETTPLKDRFRFSDKKRTFTRDRWIFQQDNDPKHTSKRIKSVIEQMKEDESIKLHVLDWPSQSPDLNPIENMWSHVKSKVSKRVRKQTSLDDQFKALEEEWKGISPDYITKVIESMPKRCKKVIEARGRQIDY